MELLFLRHGPAEPKSGWNGDDQGRPLTAQGKLLVGELACSLPKLKTNPDVVLTSPYRRARETAEIVDECVGSPGKVVVDKRLAPGFGMRQLEKMVRDYADLPVLMLVGHNPDFSELVRALTGGRLSVRKGGLAQVEIPDHKVMKGRLVCLLVPAPADPGASARDEEP